MILNRLTLRARLTVVYGGLFLLAGTLLLAVTYVLVEQRLPTGFVFKGSATPGEMAAGVGAGAPEFSQRVVIGDATVPVADLPNQLRSTALSSLLTQGGISLGLVSAAALGFGWLIAGRTLEPLHRITATAKRIAGAPAADRGLHERIALEGPTDEVKKLADTFDAMLERLDHAFDGQRRFVANASHELRTPLTLNRSLIEVALRRSSASADVRQLGEVLLEINDRHERLIEGLLLLARSENELTTRSYVDISDVVEHVVGQSTGEAEGAGVALLCSRTEAPVMGDPVLLERLVQNLVQNGIRHNVAAEGWVRLRVGAGGPGHVELVVQNTGPVVPPYDVPTLFEPFRRLENDRLAGAGVGLGLSIVRSVVRAHGGEVRATPRAGGGLVVTVTLPAAPAEG